MLAFFPGKPANIEQKIDQGGFAEEIGHMEGLSYPYEFGQSATIANGKGVPTYLQSIGLDPTYD